MVCSGLDIISVLADHFIRFFSINGSLLEVSLTFCKVEKPTVYSWNAAISAYIGVDQEVIFNSSVFLFPTPIMRVEALMAPQGQRERGTT